MRTRAFTFWEGLVACATLCTVAVIVWPMFHRPVSFRDTRIPAVRYQNVELSSALSNLYGVIQKQRGSDVDYIRHFSWENNTLKRRRVWLATNEDRSVREVMQRIEQSAQVKFDYLQRPYHPGDVGRFIIRDARSKIAQSSSEKFVRPLTCQSSDPSSACSALSVSAVFRGSR